MSSELCTGQLLGLISGVGRVSYFELLVLCELWAGERPVLGKLVPRYRRLGRPTSVSAVPLGPGIDVCRSCRFIGVLVRALCALLGGLGRFLPCVVGANHCRLRHLGCEKCAHGLTSRPRKPSTVQFLSELLVLFCYPPKSGAALLEVTLPFRYCAVRFACKVPAWRLPTAGNVAGLVTEDGEEVGQCMLLLVLMVPAVLGFGWCWWWWFWNTTKHNTTDTTHNATTPPTKQPKQQQQRQQQQSNLERLRF